MILVMTDHPCLRVGHHSNLEIILPSSIFYIILHFLIHIVHEVKYLGPFLSIRCIHLKCSLQFLKKLCS
jgi:hypothetical protein